METVVPTNIFLLRHGFSEANHDKRVHHSLPDHAIPLTDLGRKQAFNAGVFFRGFIQSNDLSGTHIRLWKSPYTRTRQTAKEFIEGAGEGIITSEREDVSLREQQFGLFDGYDDDELSRVYPTEHQHYKRCEDFGGRFYAKMPMGESRCDVAERVKPFFSTLFRDAASKGIKTVVIVGHGVTNRAFAMQWLHLTPEWLESERNPKNCSIRFIQRDQNGHNRDRGYIYSGNDPKPT